MVTDPYDIDDEAPTLQRQAPSSGPISGVGSGAGARHAESGRFVSGIRAAYVTPPAASLADAFDTFEIAFSPEADTAADGMTLVPLAPLPLDMLAQTSEIEELEDPDALEADDEASPADGEKDTVNLPADLEAVLRRASATDEDA